MSNEIQKVVNIFGLGQIRYEVFEMLPLNTHVIIGLLILTVLLFIDILVLMLKFLILLGYIIQLIIVIIVFISTV